MLAPFLIMLREGFEATLVIAILYAYLVRSGRRELLGSLWLGVGVAAAVATAIGVGIHLTIHDLTGAARLRAFAAVSLFAVAMLTWMLFWMRAHASSQRAELQGSLDAALRRGSTVRFAVISAAFVAVLREGLEAALFLIALGTGESGWSVLLGGVAGLAIAAGLGYAVAFGGHRMPLKHFFTVTGLALIVFAAGLLSKTVLFLQADGDLPIFWDNIYDLRSVTWLTQSSEIGKFLAALTGWDPRPSFEQALVWVGYTAVAAWLYLRGTRPQPRQEPAAAES